MHTTTAHPLTAIETQLISRTRPYNTHTWGPSAGRYLHTDGANPQVEVEGAQALLEKGYLEITHSHHGGGTWYELTPQGLQYFHAVWPNRKDQP